MSMFKREIWFDIDEGGEDALRISGTLRDTRLGAPLHVIEVRAEIGLADARIHAIEGEMPHVPYDECRHGLLTLQRLVGERIVPGFTQMIRDVVGSPEGCSHLAVLVTNLGHAGVQGQGALLMSRLGGDEEALRLMRKHAVELDIIGGCHTWREGGPLMTKMRAEIEAEARGREEEEKGDHGG